MLSYSHKYLDVPTPSEHNWIEGDEDQYYLKDPDLRLDNLPQPFRMIDKLIGCIIDGAWESIERREAEREAEKLKIKPPTRESSEEIQLPGNLNCFANSVDANSIFVGLSEGVGVLNMEDHTVKSVWNMEGIEIAALQVRHVGGQLYLLAALDDMGVARLIFSYGDAFALIKVFNAFDNVSEKITCSKFELSEGGDFAGLTLEGKGESWLEVHRLPKDNWVQELEQFEKQMTQLEQSGKRSVQPAPMHATQTQQDSSTSNKQANLLNIQDAKLTLTVLVMKQRPKQITDYLWKNPFDALQKLDDANIIGTGQNHVISAQQWIEEKKIFEEMYDTYLSKDTSEESEEKQSQATFHFLNLGRIFPVGLEQRTQFGIPNTLCVWWHGSHVLLHYALKIPVGKEKIELDPKADIVWPNASPITCSASEVCASLLVIALADGTITIWDLYLGIPISVLSVSRDSTIRNLHFLESNFCVPFGSPNEYREVQVLVTCKHGAVYLVKATKHTEGSISTLRKRNEEPGVTVSAIALVPQLSKFLLIFTNGTIALLHLTQGDVLCQCILPPSHVIASPWEPVFGFDKGGSFLFIKGDEKLNDDSLDRKESSSSLFAFSLLFLFSLDSCRKGKELRKPPTPNTWEKRCEHFLQERLNSVMSRNEEMTKCWNQLQDHATLVSERKETKKKLCSVRS
ncbi:WD repeat-containing protein 93 [Scyliorhinus canicula]|uniref:WD repeat-containing protein 93 n=1 Tax=Scyliorhinus canicula TaxID=7830 RepID=UPI0018F642AC|nr:WD repeat-containing protein 93 [Scyliorhinus canicula]XP_038670563.1 WD repeat-containing protein 93 [Scyliorhinus canicula]XP_038670564.1 WD repeat-containing protein 93 [Scyliorhinus canicula]